MTQQERKWCPACRRELPLGWFAPSEHCGSPAAYHHLCAPCQETWRVYWSARLAEFFAGLAVAA